VLDEFFRVLGQFLLRWEWFTCCQMWTIQWYKLTNAGRSDLVEKS
jgi:hypothetical protein